MSRGRLRNPVGPVQPGEGVTDGDPTGLAIRAFVRVDLVETQLLKDDGDRELPLRPLPPPRPPPPDRP